MKPIIAVPAIAALVFRAWSRKSLTPIGIFTAFATAVVHAVHPWSVFFALLAVFFLAGTSATKVKHDIKAKLTQSANGAAGGKGPRTHVQVLANSLTASILILLHAWQLHKEGTYAKDDRCWRQGSDVLVMGIVANYAATCADTFSSELGILSKSKPRLVTAPWRVVPPGTNGGVSLSGLSAGLLGGFIIASASTLLIPFCDDWSWGDKIRYTQAMTLAGLGGSLLDSVLGALLQASVVDVHSGKVVEGPGGKKVLVHGNTMHFKPAAELRSKAVSHEEGKDGIAKTSAVDSSLDESVKVTRAMQKAGASGTAVADPQHESRKIAVGRDILDNNAVNLLMAALLYSLTYLISTYRLTTGLAKAAPIDTPLLISNSNAPRNSPTWYVSSRTKLDIHSATQARDIRILSNKIQSLRFVPQKAHPTFTSLETSAPSAPGVHDTLRSRLAQTSSPATANSSTKPVELQSAHPLEARLVQWRETQDKLKMEMLRRQFGIAEPIRRGMELKIAREGEWKPAALGGTSGVHRDILEGRDCEIGWEDVYVGNELREVPDFHTEMETKMKMNW
ncbi:hypothetical protein N0V90_003970 [Kalmusia sp. IMI 367209]|nr:hypothetical protein N0V90_003970 [Kalmusia sp. IMI 367209]